jgi:hypothetical protein
MKITAYILLIFSVLYFSSCDRIEKWFSKNEPEAVADTTSFLPDSLFTFETEVIKKLNEKLSADSLNAELYYARSNEYLRLEQLQASFKDILKPSV